MLPESIVGSQAPCGRSGGGHHSQARSVSSIKPTASGPKSRTDHGQPRDCGLLAGQLHGVGCMVLVNLTVQCGLAGLEYSCGDRGRVACVGPRSSGDEGGLQAGGEATGAHAEAGEVGSEVDGGSLSLSLVSEERSGRGGERGETIDVRPCDR